MAPDRLSLADKIRPEIMVQRPGGLQDERSGLRGCAGPDPSWVRRPTTVLKSMFVAANTKKSELGDISRLMPVAPR